MSAPITDVLPPKKRRIVDAARQLFLEQGLRATTMEAIAREAAMAKPTLYSQYSNKDAVMSAVIEDIAERICAPFTHALQGDGWVGTRIGAALVDKYVQLGQMIGTSPHADALLNPKHRTSARFQELDAQAENDIAQALKQANVAAPRPLARLICAAAFGIAYRYRDEPAMRRAIIQLCDRLVPNDIPTGTP